MSAAVPPADDRRRRLTARRILRGPPRLFAALRRTRVPSLSALLPSQEWVRTRIQ